MFDRRRLLGLSGASVLAACAPGEFARASGMTRKASEFSPDGLAALNAAMDGFVADGSVAGVTALLLHRGREIAFHAQGEQARATGAPMARDTLFRIFSMTKPITAVVMMQLYEQGRWGLDDPIARFLPEMAALKVGAGQAGEELALQDPVRPPNLREIMSHTGGFAYGYPGDERPANVMFRNADVSAATSLDNLVARVAALPLLAQPGTEWNYSISTDLLGAVIERITGQPLDVVFREMVFEPLGMTDTGFVLPEGGQARLADLYVTNPATGGVVPVSALPPIGPIAGLARDYAVKPPALSAGGGLVSSIDNYARFARVLAEGGTSGEVRLLRPETVALMGSNQIPLVALSKPNANRIPFGPALGFGLGVMVATDPRAAGMPDGRGTMSWDGAASTWFWADPENELVFVGMVQRIGGPTRLQLQALSREAVYAALAN